MLICVCFHDITLTKQNKKVMRLDSLFIEQLWLIEEELKKWRYIFYFFSIIHFILYNTWLIWQLIYFCVVCDNNIDKFRQ